MQAGIQPEHGMSNRSTTAVAMRRWKSPVKAMLAAMAALPVLTADPAATQPRRTQVAEATAPRQAGEPIMAIVSIKS